MCRWGCITIDTVSNISTTICISLNLDFDSKIKTYQCKWCGTRFCAECLRGDFNGEMKPGETLQCKKCKQVRGFYF